MRVVELAALLDDCRSFARHLSRRFVIVHRTSNVQDAERYAILVSATSGLKDPRHARQLCL